MKLSRLLVGAFCAVVIAGCGGSETTPSEPTAAERATWADYGRSTRYRLKAFSSLDAKDPLMPFVGLEGYTLAAVNGDVLMAFYKEGADADVVVAGVERALCPASACKPVTWRSPTTFSAWELRSLEEWLVVSPLMRWGSARVEWRELTRDGEPSEVRLVIEMPESAWEDARAVLTAAGVPEAMYRLSRVRPHQAG